MLDTPATDLTKKYVMSELKSRVAVLIGGSTDELIPGYGGTLDAVDPEIKHILGPEIERVSYDEAVASRNVVGVMTLTHAHVDAALLDALGPNVKCVSNYGVGVNHIDLEECARRGIPVGNTPGVLSDATADLAWTLLLACARKIPQADRYTRGPEFTTYVNLLLLGADVSNKTIGVIGMGNIGGEVARRALGFKMRTLYYNRSRKSVEIEEELNATYASLETLLAESDFVVLACPLTSETAGIIDASALRAMKRTAILINIGRGGLIKQDALLASLEDDGDAGIAMAGLDVSTPEPLPRDHPLLSRDDVVWTPHRGSATAGTRRAMAELAVRNLKLGLAGEDLECCCNGVTVAVAQK